MCAPFDEVKRQRNQTQDINRADDIGAVKT
jgi:hypothetical protein